MNKMYLMGCIGILAASAMLSSCSSDDESNGGTGRTHQNAFASKSFDR